MFDTTYTDEGEISDELRHAFFFPSVQVEKGDLVRVHTKEGKYKRWVSSTETVYHDFFWGLDEPIWNDEGDCALLIEVTDQSSKCVGE